MVKDLLNHLSKKDHIELMSLSHQFITCRNTNDFKKLVLDLRNQFNHDHAVLVYGNINEAISRSDLNKDMLNISFPQDFLDYYFENGFQRSDTTFCEYLRELKPVHWATVNKKSGYLCEAAAKALDYNLRGGWTYGVLNPRSMNCCLVNLACSHTKNKPRNRAILEFIIPFLAESYLKILHRYSGLLCALTPREIEVLNWIKDGKSSWDISMIFKCSKRVVDFHVNNIKQKLNAVSRAQAVAIGLHQGIIRF